MSIINGYKRYLCIALVCIIVGVIAGRKTVTTSSQQIRTVVVTKEHVVERIKTVTKPDGTKIEDKVVTRDADVSQKIDTSIIPNRDNYHVSLDASVGIDLKPVYGLQVERKVLGPLAVGLRISNANKGTVGVVLGLSF